MQHVELTFPGTRAQLVPGDKAGDSSTVRLPVGTPVALTLFSALEIDDLEPPTDPQDITAFIAEVQARRALLPALDLSGLAEIPDGALSSLAILAGDITDAEAVEVGRMGSLRRLVVSGGEGFTRAGLETITSLPSLEELELTTRGLAARDTTLLGSLRRLRTVKLTGSLVSDAACAQLAQVPGLESITLSQGSVTAAGFEQLCSLPLLRSLDISRGDIGDAALQSLRGLPSLELINMGAVGLSSRAADVIAELPQQLTAVRLWDVDVPLERSIPVHQAHPGIRFQDVSYGPRALAKLAAQLSGAA